MMGGPGGGPAATGPRFVWNRGLTLSGFYTYGQNYDNTDGAFVIPASIFLADEWGPAAFDRRHNTHIALTSTALPELQCPSRILGLVRAAPDDSHRDRRQRRPRLQRPARRRRPQLRANHVDLQFVGELRLLVHPGQEDGDIGRRGPDHGLAGRSHGQPDGIANDAALPAEPVGEHQQSLEPGVVLGIQQHHHLEELPEAELRVRMAPDHVCDERELLIGMA